MTKDMLSPSTSTTPDDLMDFIDEDESIELGISSDHPWSVLIVDDDRDVHQSTLMAMRDIRILGQPVRFLHAYSATEALALIQQEEDLALILLDVVMESPQAGLDLVRRIREELQRDAVRIILRTGQPGYAPEIETIQTYDINDYKTKTELTRVRLFTSLTVGIRSYQQIRTLQQTRHGLELIVQGSTELSKLRGLQTFSEGVVTQICSLLGFQPEGLVCVQAPLSADETPLIIAAAGQYRHLLQLPLQQVELADVRQALGQCLREQRHLLGEHCCLYFSTSTGRGMAAYINSPRMLAPIDQDLLAIFCSSISVAMENVLLYSQLLDVAYQDQMLHLPNRHRFAQLIEQQMAQPEGYTLALLDINDFSSVNNSLGHHFGDQVLQGVGQRLANRLSPEVILARISGDTFGVLGLDNQVNPAILDNIFSLPFSINNETLRIAVSIGLVRLTEPSTSGSDLIKDAELALRRAKSDRRGKAQYFTSDMVTQIRERMRLLVGLRNAFEEDRLFVVYQPQVDLANGQVLGFEALLRCRTETGELVPPDLFIPLAEHSGLIVPLGEFVLRTALHELRKLHALGHHHLSMSINVSRVQLHEPDFPDTLRRAMLDAQVDARFVELEITESTAMSDVDFMISALADLRSQGVSIAIDDFGTGYSSLSILRQLSVQRLKIDKSFVDQIDQDADQRAIAQMIIELAQLLKLSVIAEGVEHSGQQALLQTMGCVQGQGYLFARPMAADQLHTWLASM